MQLLNRLALATLLTPALTGSLATAQDSGWAHFSPWFAPDATDFAQAGAAVELDGDWAFLAAIGTAEVDVYRRTGATWSYHQTLQNPEGSNGLYGYDTDLEDGVLYVGARSSMASGIPAGAVYAYELNGDSWKLAEVIVQGTPTNNARFGSALDVNGNWMVVSAPWAGSNGRAHVFYRSAGSWAEVGVLNRDDAETFGGDVAIAPTASGLSADVFVSDFNAFGLTGAVFPFRASLFGWSDAAPVLPEQPVASARWGAAIEYDGEHLAIAADRGSSQGAVTGEVAIYDVDNSVWPVAINHAETVYPDLSQADALFGSSIALADGRLAVGAQHYQVAPQHVTGAVYVYRPDAFFDGWSLEAELVSDFGSHAGLLGDAVAIDGEYVLAGSPGALVAAGAGQLFSLAPKSFPGGMAPADIVATVETYGLGKPGTLGVPDFHANSMPVHGESALMGLSNAAEGTVPIIAWGLEPAALPFDGGMLLVEPLGTIVMPAIGLFGQVGWNWEIGNAPELIGETLYAQALLVDPGAAGPLQTAQSRGLALTIGF